MQENPIKMELYDKRQQMSSIIYVDKIGENVYRTIENELFNCRLTLGTEFETRTNKDGKHEIVRIIKDSAFITRRFFLNSSFSKSDYQILGDEIIKQGGFWQVDFGGIATVNLPRDCDFSLDRIFQVFDFKPVYLTED